ncbi:hypothetical protein [Chitinophaga filiformis]|uniref:Lipoprotein n=1 Tax=Chitinophaga filiformis TaxID=104663 RepID=A0A1G7MY74_CHIFI|nr:hypothetical protein [Chitinophaga filiformis]SDF66704.1 hypothetical protein SAMN04488121_102598 [Chitinophaga filiformis]
MPTLFHRSAAFLCISGLIFACTRPTPADSRVTSQDSLQKAATESSAVFSDAMKDTTRYQRCLLHLVHNNPSEKWPVYGAVPPAGALLPYHRIVAFYGNLYTPAMGILGIPEEEMLARLKEETARWQQADTMIPVLPALHYIAVTAQENPGPSGKYRLRMPQEELEKMVAMAKEQHTLLFLDVQVGLSTLQDELPLLETYLQLPEVHLGIDPEYSMKNLQVPSSSIGTFDAADINYAITFLSGIVKKYNLSPKILVVHRFTQAMLTNYKDIKKVPEVQIVINMDGFGSPAKKIDSYTGFVAKEPVQYTGFKLFYKVDPKTGKRMMRPEEVLALYPSPVYIQYQ